MCRPGLGHCMVHCTVTRFGHTCRCFSSYCTGHKNLVEPYCCTLLKSQYIYQESKTLATLQTFESFLAGLGRNQAYCSYCSPKTTHTAVYKSLAKQKQALELTRYTSQTSNNFSFNVVLSCCSKQEFGRRLRYIMSWF